MYVTSSPTAVAAQVVGDAGERVQRGPVGVQQGQRLGVGEPGRVVGGRATGRRVTSASMRSGTMPGAAASRSASQSPYTSSKSSRRSPVRPSVSMVRCRSVRPAGGVNASSGSCHGRPSTDGVRAGEARSPGRPARARAAAAAGPARARRAARTPGRRASRSRSSKPAARGPLGQLVDLRPGALGVDVVGGERGDAAPVVDPGADAAARTRRRPGSAAPGCRRPGP